MNEKYGLHYNDSMDDPEQIRECLNCKMPSAMCHGNCRSGQIKRSVYCIVERETNNVIFSGSMSACADFVGETYNAFYAALHDHGGRGKYFYRRSYA